MDFIEGKWMKRRVKYWMLCLFLVWGGSVISKELSSKEREINFIIYNFAEEMCKKYQLYCVGEGGNLNDGIHNIDVIFKAYRRLSLDEARMLEVNVIERLLELINHNEKIRPYLSEYPFTVSRVMVSISVEMPNGDRPIDGSIAYIFTAKNKIFFDAAKLETYTTQPPIDASGKGLGFKFVPQTITEAVLVPLYEEPYEEALRIVKGSK